MQAQLSALREELDGEKEHRAELTHQNASLSEAVAVANVALNETKDSLRQKTLQCDHLEAQLRETLQKVRDLESKLKRSGEQMAALEARVHDLEVRTYIRSFARGRVGACRVGARAVQCSAVRAVRGCVRYSVV